MKRLIVLALLALPVFAADYELGIRHLVAMPTGDSGALDIPMSRGFAGTVEAFWTERISTQFAASFVNPEAIYGDEVDLGTLGLDIYSVTVRYHFAPTKRLSAYAGGGPALVIIGNLDDQFGDAIEAEFGNASTFLVEGGVRYLLLPRLRIEAGVSYMPLTARTSVIRSNDPRVVLPDEIRVNSAMVTVGATWRF